MNQSSHNVYLRTKGCTKNLYSYKQDDIFNSLSILGKPSVRQLSKLFKNSFINERYSIFKDLLSSKNEEIDFEKLSLLSTAKRNDLYRQYAPKMFKSASLAVIDEITDLKISDITHVVTVSCTGCYSPGPGDELIKALGLSNMTEKFHIGYMGCYAGLAGIRLANSICKSSIEAVVLIVCVEISSLHWRYDESDDNKLSMSLFSDGSAAAIVSSRKFGQSFSIESVGSELIPDTETEMGWQMGETGFEMTLSREVPAILESKLEESINRFAASSKLDVSEIAHWAVHPGGARILQLLEKKFGIETKINPAWQTLKDFGNMSSATIFFVLESVLSAATGDDSVIALAFGPGLTIEKSMLKVSD